MSQGQGQLPEDTAGHGALAMLLAGPVSVPGRADQETRVHTERFAAARAMKATQMV